MPSKQATDGSGGGHRARGLLRPVRHLSAGRQHPRHTRIIEARSVTACTSPLPLLRNGRRELMPHKLINGTVYLALLE